MANEEKHEIKMMYAVYADGRKEPVVINEIKDLSMEEAEPILEEYSFVKVTRCKDCKWFDSRYDFCHNPRWGNGWGNYPPPTVTEERFCCDGEREKDERK